jgi:phenylpropionate dioxygenase-like ring-hydroxylating dioxygenase large terminal subunit
MPSFLGYLGLGVGPHSPTSKNGDSAEAVRALPAIWYTSPEMYELERRSIFSRKWMIITHSVRLKEIGSYLRYDIAGFQFVLSKDREGKINAFHNVCRHRAFPVVTEEKGTAKIFSCLYHGWSYGLNGKLAKAPGYSDLPTFDKTKNSLFSIHVHIDGNGFVWINLDAKPEPEIAWSDDFAGMENLPRYDGVKWDDFVYDHTWEMECNYNWKIAADNYNECYHCKTVHPDIPNIADLTAYSVDNEKGMIIHNPGTKEDQAAAGLTVAPTYFFPNASMTIT